MLKLTYSIDNGKTWIQIEGIQISYESVDLKVNENKVDNARLNYKFDKNGIVENVSDSDGSQLVDHAMSVEELSTFTFDKEPLHGSSTVNPETHGD